MTEKDLGRITQAASSNIDNKYLGDVDSVGYREVSAYEYKNEDYGLVFSDRNNLKGNLKLVVDLLQDEGKEVWGRYSAHKGFVLTIIGAAAAAAGVVGIGIRIKRRGEKDE